MDILIGGIPRSGTTALARGVALHPDIFCWFSESGLMPRIADLTRGMPLLPANIPALEQMLFRYLHSTLIDMAAWNAERFDPEAAPTLTDANVMDLSRAVVAILAQQLPRPQTLLECARLLRAFLATQTDRPVIAEKTPSNVLLFDEPVPLAQRWLMMHREPFAVIASMAARAGNDPWATPFAGEIERRIGLYMAHARAVESAMAQPDRARVFGYQRLTEDTVSVLAEICMFLEADLSRGFIHDVSSIVAGERPIDHWVGFDAFDRWKVLHLCASSMRAFGYDERFYGVSFRQMTRDLPLRLDAKVESLHGIGLPEGGKKTRWMEGHGSLAVYAPKGANTLTLKIYNRIADLAATAAEMGIDVREWHIRAYGAIAAEAPMPLGELYVAGDDFAEWKIDLRAAEPIGHHGNWRLFKIDLVTNFSYTPVFSVPEGLDERDLSVLLVEWAVS